MQFKQTVLIYESLMQPLAIQSSGRLNEVFPPFIYPTNHVICVLDKSGLNYSQGRDHCITDRMSAGVLTMPFLYVNYRLNLPNHYSIDEFWHHYHTLILDIL